MWLEHVCPSARAKTTPPPPRLRVRWYPLAPSRSHDIIINTNHFNNHNFKCMSEEIRNSSQEPFYCEAWLLTTAPPAKIIFGNELVGLLIDILSGNACVNVDSRLYGRYSLVSLFNRYHCTFGKGPKYQRPKVWWWWRVEDDGDTFLCAGGNCCYFHWAADAEEEETGAEAEEASRWGEEAPWTLISAFAASQTHVLPVYLTDAKSLAEMLMR